MTSQTCKKTLREELDEFYRGHGLGHIADIMHVPQSEEPGVARRGWRARKGQRTEKDEQLPKHLRYR